MMDKLELQSADVTAKNVEAIAALFPQVVTEGRDDEGNLVHRVDFEALRQEISDYVVDGAKEVYQIDWPGKLAAEFASNAPISKTLRPNRADSIAFDTTKNLFIEGDNLEALKLLQESYLGKVRLIYIDPPYNTGGDLVYRDDFATSKQEYLWQSGQVNEAGERLVANTESNGRFHSDWLSMIYPRLRLAKRFLAQDGVILVSIDDAEQASLRRLMDEVFGEQNFIAQLVWEKGRKNDAKFFSNGHEYVMVYAKSKSYLREQKTTWREEKPGAREIWDEYLRLREMHATDAATEKDLSAWFAALPRTDPSKKWARYKRVDANGPWRDDNISWPGGGGPRYDVIHPVTGQPCKVPERGWIWPDPETMKEKIRLGIVVFRDDHTEPPFRKSHLRPIAGEDDAEEVQQNNDDDVELALQVRGTYFYKQSQVSVKHLRGLMGAQVFNNPKDHTELSRLFEYVLGGKSGIVMDFFAGSGTTAEAVFDLCARTGLNCPVILVQLPERLEDNLKTATGSSKTTIQNAIKLLEKLGKPLTIAELTKIRIGKAGELVVANRKPSDWNGDGGFRAFTIDTSNFADVAMTPDTADQVTLVDLVESVKTDRSNDDVLFEVLIDWGVDLSSPISVEPIGGHEVLSVEDDALLACFDDDLDDDLIRNLAKRKPLKAVFKDTAFATDAARINAGQIFEQLSPDTNVKVL
ncbi:adenine-specific DNA-methyltransferase [Cryobacterium sp. MP_M5]|uniref:site-specific DNA-methyltransferase n=1 Tax=unclassified Cryobacterium TaxID=2649013 RepID=UPI0018C9D615|nr:MULTISPECIES: site-specific DNA-methyltransferase [unclassified Cryobacterium]MBG6059957.1 adenine-specific DNA-methyltransferase [Cryobacterium sp. MP_M3]MEC5178375.1 adenine-specific DNA-methyltransferase [Cryobacterium sp. MP_M5]